jgi:hypothetical protein
MAYTVTKNADGDVNLGTLQGVFVTLQPAAADYVSGTGYALIDGVAVVDGAAASTQNIDLYRLQALLAAMNCGGYVLQLSIVGNTKAIRVYRQNASTGALQECPTGTDLSALAFVLLLAGV